MKERTRSLDLGCGPAPKNPFSCDEVYGVDIRDSAKDSVLAADLAIEPIPFQCDWFDAVTAFDFIEHIPRIVYCPHRRFSFVDLMNEIYRVLKKNGQFLSITPAFPKAAAWRDPTHVNIITEETFPLYFDDQNRLASMYGFSGAFRIEEQKWHENGMHLVTLMRKVQIP